LHFVLGQRSSAAQRAWENKATGNIQALPKERKEEQLARRRKWRKENSHLIRA
jgi:hypothetical protein